MLNYKYLIINTYILLHDDQLLCRNIYLTVSETLCPNIMYLDINFNFILPKVNTDYMRQAQVLNIDKLRLIINLRKFNENVK